MAVSLFARAPRNTHLGSEAKLSISIFIALTMSKLQKSQKPSRRTAICGMRGGSIRRKVIRHKCVPGLRDSLA